MSELNQVIYNHPHFKNLTKEELDHHLDFLAKVLFSLNGFEVWEAENVFSPEEDKKWNTEVVERFTQLVEDKKELENKLYCNNVGSIRHEETSLKQPIQTKECEGCNGSGFSGQGTGYDSVCDDCGGKGEYPL